MIKIFPPYIYSIQLTDMTKMNMTVFYMNGMISNMQSLVENQRNNR